MAQYHHSRGIVLSALKYGESSRIVRVYTEEFGLLSFLVNSVGSKRGVVRSSMLLPLSLLELVHTNKGEGKLDRIKEAKMDLTFTSIPYDPVRNALALFLSELFQKVLQTGEANSQKEAERQRIEAEGKAVANRLLSQSLTDKILQDKGIDATLKLAESPNSKVIVVGGVVMDCH